MKPLLRLMALVLLAGGVHAAATPRYLFEDFERENGWKPGRFSHENSGFTLAQGRARIVTFQDSENQGLELEPSDPFAAVMLDASPVADRSIVYGETFVRPVVLGESASDEFLDFGGAVVGFFRDGDIGEICALYSKSPEESVWISSGWRFPIESDGRSKEWMRLTIRLNQKARRWDLVINGRPALRGLRAISPSRGLRLWLYGDKTQPVWFDDVLVSTLDPDALEAELSRAQSQRREISTTAPTGRQLVIREKSNADLREAADTLSRVRGSVRLNDWKASLTSGDRTYERPENAASDVNLIAYAPAYDEEGNPLPVTLTLTADAELEPGADLSRLRWRVNELLGVDDRMRPKVGVVVAEGDFESGLVQTVTIPEEWARKATSVLVWQAK